jgi:hypothetical protein
MADIAGRSDETKPCPCCGHHPCDCYHSLERCVLKLDEGCDYKALARQLAEVLKKYHDREDISHEPGVVDALAAARDAGLLGKPLTYYSKEKEAERG